MKAYRCYLIQNASGKRYIGLSEDVAIRLQDHNSGISKYTAKHGPWELQWTSYEMDLSKARKVENLLKKQKGGNGLQPLLQKFQGMPID
jgi:putative endonuclease